MRTRPRPDPIGPGQGSVWDHPRPPVAVPTDEHVVVEAGGVVLADSRRAVRVLETSHPPTYYVPTADVHWDLVVPNDHHTVCEFKGVATYGDVVVGQHRIRDACWWYARPAPGFELLAGAVCFYPQRVGRCLVDGEPVRAVDGDFYGGWITARVVGPFKGGPGTLGW